MHWAGFISLHCDFAHVRRIEAGDHRIESRLLFLRQRFVCHRDPRIGEGVVVQRGVRMQVIGRSALPVHPVGPFLLQGNAENRHAAGLVAHHAQEIADVRPFLNIIGQVEMRIVEVIRGGLRGRHRATEKICGGKRRNSKVRIERANERFMFPRDYSRWQFGERRVYDFRKLRQRGLHSCQKIIFQAGVNFPGAHLMVWHEEKRFGNQPCSQSGKSFQ